MAQKLTHRLHNSANSVNDVHSTNENRTKARRAVTHAAEYSLQLTNPQQQHHRRSWLVSEDICKICGHVTGNESSVRPSRLMLMALTGVGGCPRQSAAHYYTVNELLLL